MNRIKIGIISTYFPNNTGYIALQIRDAFQKAGYSVFILARMLETNIGNQLFFTDEFYHNNLFLYPQYQVKDKDFGNWVIGNKIDRVIFIEEHYSTNLIELCNKLQIPSFNYISLQYVNPGNLDYYKQFTKLIHSVKHTSYMFSKYLNNLVYIPWGIDIHNSFRFQEPVEKEKIQFLFLGGFENDPIGENEEAVIKAFSNVVTRNKTVLRIHIQGEGQEVRSSGVRKTYGILNHNDLISLYKESDIILLPSKWCGNNLAIYRANACGRPVIGTDTTPFFNDVIINLKGSTGILCKVNEFKEYQEIFIKGAEINIEDFAEKMVYLSENKELLYNMQINSRQIAEENFDWGMNSKVLLDEILGEN
jgi:glycosyltransferase involved in cell wall biosynthesis